MSLDLGAVKAEPGIALVSLEVEDLFFDTEPVLVRAQPTREDALLTAAVTDSSTNTVIAQKAMTAGGDGWHSAQFEPLAEGAYRVTITGEKTETASDAFAVGPEASDTDIV